MHYERLIYDILKEEEFKAKSKETGKVVTFKSKDTMKAAIKGGSHEPMDKKKATGAQSKDFFSGFDTDIDQKEKPKTPGHKSRGMGTAVTDKYKEGDIVDAKIAIGDLSDGLSNGGKKNELVDLYGKIDQANRGMADDEDWEAMARDLSPEVKQEIQDYADIHSDGAQVLKPVLDVIGEPEADDSESGKDYTRKFMGTDEPDDDAADIDTGDGEEESPGEKLIDAALDGVSPNAKEETFDKTINMIGNQEEFKKIIDDIEAHGTDMPEEYEGWSHKKIAYGAIMSAYDRDELSGSSDEMDVQNFLANYEEDLYSRMMEGAAYKPWTKQYNRLFESLSGI